MALLITEILQDNDAIMLVKGWDYYTHQELSGIISNVDPNLFFEPKNGSGNKYSVIGKIRDVTIDPHFFIEEMPVIVRTEFEKLNNGLTIRKDYYSCLTEAMIKSVLPIEEKDIIVIDK